MPYFFRKSGKISQNLLSAAVVIGALRINNVTLCMQGIFSNFLSSADFFSKLTLSKNYFGNTIRVSNSLDPDGA